MQCAKCAAELPTQAGRGRPRKYCDSHRTVDVRQRYVLVDHASRDCAECGTAFKPTMSRAKFCSAVCYVTARDRGRMFPCSDCAKPMWHSSDRAERPSCRECRKAKMSPAVDPIQRWNCVECGTHCERPRTKGQQPAFCRECRSRRTYWITDRERISLYERDNWICWLCEEDVDAALIGSKSEWRPSLDHVTPRSKGGDSSDGNLKLAHFWCNVVRGDGRCSPEVFRASA